MQRTITSLARPMCDTFCAISALLVYLDVMRSVASRYDNLTESSSYRRNYSTIEGGIVTIHLPVEINTKDPQSDSLTTIIMFRDNS